MSTYKFRITFEDYHETYRDIELLPEHTFQQFLQAILQAIKFDDKQIGTFYHTDDLWRIENKITEISFENKKDTTPELADEVSDPYQRFVLVYDVNKKWVFNIELIKIGKENSANIYPLLLPNATVLPTQYRQDIVPKTRKVTDTKDKELAFLTGLGALTAALETDTLDEDEEEDFVDEDTQEPDEEDIAEIEDEEDLFLSDIDLGNSSYSPKASTDDSDDDIQDEFAELGEDEYGFADSSYDDEW